MNRPTKRKPLFDMYAPLLDVQKDLARAAAETQRVLDEEKRIFIESLTEDSK